MSLSYDYYPAVLYAIDLISQGRTKTFACDASNINIATFDNYVNSNPELQSMLHEAEQRGYDAMADALVDIDSHKTLGRSDPKMAKVISDNIKWLLSKRKVKEYGDRIQVTHNITADKAITDALIAGRNRAGTAFIAAPTIEDVVYEIVDDVDHALMVEMGLA